VKRIKKRRVVPENLDERNASAEQLRDSQRFINKLRNATFDYDIGEPGNSFRPDARIIDTPEEKR
jgi:hypothetical protein